MYVFFEHVGCSVYFISVLRKGAFETEFDVWSYAVFSKEPAIAVHSSIFERSLIMLLHTTHMDEWGMHCFL